LEPERTGNEPCPFTVVCPSLGRTLLGLLVSFRPKERLDRLFERVGYPAEGD
jgi:hypothetical protein